MGEALTVYQFQSMVTTRLYCEKLRRDRDKFSMVELIPNVGYAANDFLRDWGFAGIKVRRRGDKLFLMNENCKRIVCELCIDCEFEGKLCKRTSVVLVNLRGQLPPNRPLEDFIRAVEKFNKGSRKDSLKNGNKRKA